MGLREDIGGKIEDKLNEAVDKAFEGDLVEMIIDKLRPELKKLMGENLAMKVKANLVDMIDGEDDIPNV